MRGTSLINCKKLPEYAPNCVHCFTMLVDAITRLYIHIYRLKIGLHVSQRVLGKKLVYVDINVAARRTPCIIEMLSIISIHRHISIHRQNFIKEKKTKYPYLSLNIFHLLITLIAIRFCPSLSFVRYASVVNLIGTSLHSSSM